ncbi:MAG: coproporphyrinogen dehydrogenase HemZ [Clostridia bacterium]|nr:coproporphyrinogen dehydrogenase HemZ [Clostridia bacterium]
MTLNITGNISRYYAETLVLLFFPGSKFPEDGSGGDPTVTVELTEGEVMHATAEIKDGDKRETAQYSPSPDTAARYGEHMLRQITVGGALLAAGEKFCGFLPPWGALTGVRPAKLAMKAMEAGDGVKVLTEDYRCTVEKAKIAVMTAETEKRFITDEARRHCSVYVAIPFCPTKCSYCSFVSYSSPRLLSMMPGYLDRLLLDIENTFEVIHELGLTVDTVYIGGGTPTTYEEKELRRLLLKIGECTDVGALQEFTLEAGRPDTITAEKMRAAKDLGVTRVSVNAQTMNGEVLRSIGRRHTPEDFLSAYHIARESGIRDINVDLIAGLPGESFESFSDSVSRIIDLSPTNLTVHTFYVKRAAQLTRELSGVCRAQDEAVERAVSAAQAKILENGYIPYYLYKQKNTAANLENTGFSKIGHECAYNIYMMEEVHTVFGAGASSMTKFVSPHSDNMKIVRLSETKYPYEYLDPAKNSAEERYETLRKTAREFYGKK